MTHPPALRTALRQAGFLLLAASIFAVLGGLLNLARGQFGAAAEGEIELAAALYQKPPPLWIDTRSPAEFAKKHIPGALPLNEEQWSALLPSVLEKWEPGQTSVVYCGSVGCRASREVAARLKEINLGPVFVLRGGWESWKQK